MCVCVGGGGAVFVCLFLCHLFFMLWIKNAGSINEMVSFVLGETFIKLSWPKVSYVRREKQLSFPL